VSELEPFDIVRTEVSGRPTLLVYGEIDVMTAPKLHEALNLVLREQPSILQIDLANVTFIDSTGLSALVVAHRQLEEAGGELRLVSVPPKVYRVFELVGLDSRFKLSAPTTHS
jgi:anti-anti-sigma factor